MTAKQMNALIDAIEGVRDENRAAARESALAFVLSGDGAAQRKALVDHATAEAQQNVLDMIQATRGADNG